MEPPQDKVIEGGVWNLLKTKSSREAWNLLETNWDWCALRARGRCMSPHRDEVVEEYASNLLETNQGW